MKRHSPQDVTISHSLVIWFRLWWFVRFLCEKDPLNTPSARCADSDDANEGFLTIIRRATSSVLHLSISQIPHFLLNVFLNFHLDFLFCFWRRDEYRSSFRSERCSWSL